MKGWNLRWLGKVDQYFAVPGIAKAMENKVATTQIMTRIHLERGICFLKLFYFTDTSTQSVITTFLYSFVGDHWLKYGNQLRVLRQSFFLVKRSTLLVGFRNINYCAFPILLYSYALWYFHVVSRCVVMDW